jgi:hypothetical protein
MSGINALIDEPIDAKVAPPVKARLTVHVLAQELNGGNTTIHTARTVKEWFREHGVLHITDSPPFSPDLNPIECGSTRARARSNATCVK